MLTSLSLVASLLFGPPRLAPAHRAPRVVMEAFEESSPPPTEPGLSWTKGYPRCVHPVASAAAEETAAAEAATAENEDEDDEDESAVSRKTEEDKWRCQMPKVLVRKGDDVVPNADGFDDYFEDHPVGRVLVIYTGGTLGMTLQDGTLAPEQGFLEQRITEMPEVHAATMPEVDYIEYDPPIDSSNISPKDWGRLARQIRDSYYDYDGFVILHGTDTMAYTASALSFMLENLGKAIVLTGSMIPLAEVYNDARRNLLIALTFAAQLELCEVVIFFDDRLIRGNRAIKVDSSGLTAFDSPNFPPLATVGATIKCLEGGWRAPPKGRMRVHTDLDARVVTLNLAPGFDDSAISAMIQHAPNLRGLVLQLYGTGNGPAQKRAFINVIKSAIDRGILVVATSQCLRGAVSLDTYEVGRKLLELGVVSAGDMTTEAVVTKMAYVRARAAPERAHVQHAHRR